jgi:uncharacterized membrane protein YcaP (DUF421 family)
MDFGQFLHDALGTGVEPKHLTVLQVCLRGVIMFSATLVMVRIGHRRFMAKLSPFDAVLGLVLASVLARAINGSAELLPTIAVGFLLVLLHRGLAALAFRSESFARLIKSDADTLVEDGKIKKDKLRVHKVSEKDLLEEARLNGQVTQLDEIEQAVMERNGKISVIAKEK